LNTVFQDPADFPLTNDFVVARRILSLLACMCVYTSHGHCGLLKDGKIDNNPRLELLAIMALAHVRAGADMAASSGMMEGQIRSVLDEAGFTDVPVMSHAAKYAYAYYEPFREVAHSALGQGDRDAVKMETLTSIKRVSADILITYFAKDAAKVLNG